MFAMQKETLPRQGTRAVQIGDAALAAPQQHSLLHSLWLHLLPGLLILAFVLIVGPVIIRAGLPLLLIPSLWTLGVLIPVEVGYLLVQGKRQSGRFSLASIIGYRAPLSLRTYGLLLPPLLIWGVIAFLLTQPAEPYITKTFFAWLPTWFHWLFTAGEAGGHHQSIRLFAVWLYLFTNPVAAFVEELYYRGYLLPRIAHLKGWAPLVSTVLFSLQHLFSPWQNLGRILGFLPIAYTVAWKKNLYIAIIAHCVLDALSAAVLLVMVYR